MRKLWLFISVVGTTLFVSGCSNLGADLSNAAEHVDAATSAVTSSTQFSNQPTHYVWEAPKKNGVVMVTLRFHEKQVDGKWQVKFYNGNQLSEHDLTIQGTRNGNQLTFNLSDGGSPEIAVMKSGGFDLYDHSVKGQTYEFYFKKATVADFDKDVQSLQKTP